MAFQGSKIPFWRFFAVFSVRGVEIFFSAQFFFLGKFDPKSVQNSLFRYHNLFWQITLCFVVKPQKSFSTIFQYKLASSRKVRSKNPGGQWCLHGKLCKSFQIWTLGTLTVSEMHSIIKLRNCHSLLLISPD